MAAITRAENDAGNAQASALAIAAAERLKPANTAVIQYHSRGRVALIGGEVAQDFAHRLHGALTPQVILTDGAEEPGVTTIPAGKRAIRIEGYLGDFRILLGQEGHASFERVAADMILDLGDKPLLNTPLPPPGYLTSVPEEPYLTAAENALRGLIGTFEKPKYFHYDVSLCAHGRSGISGCTRCIDACPADAITSLVESVAIDPYLCQGGGACASVCPTGAVRYASPGVIDTLHAVRTLLERYDQADGSDPVIGFIAAVDVDHLDNRPANLLPVIVEELASIGMDGWLSALAYGATRVLLIETGSSPSGVAASMSAELATTKSILAGLGYDADSIQLAAPESLDAQCRVAGVSTLSWKASYAGSQEKRRTVLQAIDHLYRQSRASREVIALPEQSLFGRIVVDTAACTLCMSCTSVCPSKAISAGVDVPRLEFHEINCVQCGICASACPENAIALEPRLIADAETRRRISVLNEETPFRCVVCGKPFATQSLIDSMTRKLEGHSMFKSERARRRLLMCEDCRVADVVQDEEAMHSF